MSEEQTFGRRIRELRKARKLDQRTLAERVQAALRARGQRGFDVTYLSKIENDRVPPPSSATITALAEELGADVYELIALAGKVPPGVGETLRASQGARMFYRTAIDLRLTEEDWQHLLREVRRRKSSPPLPSGEGRGEGRRPTADRRPRTEDAARGDAETR